MPDVAFPSSWQNRFFDRVDRLPIPNLAVYVLILVGLTLLNHLAPWLEGKLPWGEIDPYQFNFQIWSLVVLIGSGYFLAFSRSALIKFRAALEIPQEEFDQLAHRFTQVPARTGWLISLMAAPLSILTGSISASYQRSGLSVLVFLATSVFLFSLVFFFFYYLVHALRMTVRLYERVEQVNIFHLEPLYAFSGLTSRIGIFFVIGTMLSYLTNIAFSETPQVGSFFFFTSINLTLAVLAFILPLGGIHRKLEGAKESASWENDRRLDEAYRALHERNDRKDFAGMADFHHSIEALLAFRTEIKSISTWPWGPGTLRSFITALLLPIVLWVAQQLISRYLAL